MSVTKKCREGPTTSAVKGLSNIDHVVVRCFFCCKRFRGGSDEECATPVPIAWLPKYLGVTENEDEGGAEKQKTDEEEKGKAVDLPFCKDCTDLAAMLEVQCEELMLMEHMLNQELRKLQALLLKKKKPEKTWKWLSLRIRTKEKCFEKLTPESGPIPKSGKLDRTQEGNNEEPPKKIHKLESADQVNTHRKGAQTLQPPLLTEGSSQTVHATSVEKQVPTSLPILIAAGTQTTPSSVRESGVQTLPSSVRAAQVQTTPPDFRNNEAQTLPPIVRHAKVQTSTPRVCEAESQTEVVPPSSPLLPEASPVVPELPSPAEQSPEPSIQIVDPRSLRSADSSPVPATAYENGFIDTFYDDCDPDEPIILPEESVPVSETISNKVKPSSHMSCPYCDEINSSQEELNLHVICDHPENLLTCLKNPLITDRQYHLICQKAFDRDITPKPGNGGFECRYCKDTFVAVKFVKAHLFNVHNQNIGLKVNQLQSKLAQMQAQRNQDSGTNPEPEGAMPMITSVTSMSSAQVATPVITSVTSMSSVQAPSAQIQVNPTSVSNPFQIISAKCPLCQEVSRTIESLRTHMASKHGMTTIIPGMDFPPAPVPATSATTVIQVPAPSAKDKLKKNPVSRKRKALGASALSKSTSGVQDDVVIIEESSSGPPQGCGATWGCSFCNLQFPTQQALIYHCDTSCKPFQCPVCGKSGFKDKLRLLLHLSSAHPQRGESLSMPEKNPLLNSMLSSQQGSQSSNVGGIGGSILGNSPGVQQLGSMPTMEQPQLFLPSVVIPPSSTGGLLTLHYE